MGSDAGGLVEAMDKEDGVLEGCPGELTCVVGEGVDTELAEPEAPGLVAKRLFKLAVLEDPDACILAEGVGWLCVDARRDDGKP